MIQKSRQELEAEETLEAVAELYRSFIHKLTHYSSTTESSFLPKDFRAFLRILNNYVVAGNLSGATNEIIRGYLALLDQHRMQDLNYINELGMSSDWEV